MKAWISAGLMMAASTSLVAAPLRVAVLDFENKASMSVDQNMGGDIDKAVLADKGVYLIGKQLVGKENFVLVDRRDFIAQMDRLKPQDGGKNTPVKPTFIHAAQLLRADVVLRGSILSLSTGKTIVNQGGHKADLSTLTLRVALEALDPKDGSVIAVADGAAKQQIRQTENLQTVLSEDDILGMMEKALNEAVPAIESALSKREAQLQARPVVKLSIKTSADPAMLEIDGVLVGSTPVENLDVYKGDHVITIGKPGHQDVTKRILFEKDTALEIPMLRTNLSADEWKEIYNKVQMKVIQVDPGVIIHTLE